MTRRCKQIYQAGIHFIALAGMIGAIGIPYTFAQEFNCEVTVNDRQISESSYSHIQDLGTDLERYINENSWTGEQYSTHERIRCGVQVVLRDVDSQYNFDADVIINMRRPVYNTMQESMAVILSDSEWTFNYQPGRSMIRDYLQFDDLTSFIDFYVYVMLGFDQDSFTELGGTRWFDRALDIFEVARTTNSPGWSRNIGNQRNRFGLITDLTNPTYEDLRRSFYQYHRLGIDQFTIDQDAARQEVITAIERINSNRQRAPRNYLFDIFFDTKYTEIVSVFQEAPAERRLQAYNLLRETDPGHSSEYEKLRN